MAAPCRNSPPTLGSDNLFLQYDIYHMQVMEGDLAATIEKHLKHIAHIADTPGRHEPGTGEINFDFLLPFIDQIGYRGWISCEYVAAAKTIEGLGWAKPYLQCGASRCETPIRVKRR